VKCSLCRGRCCLMLILPHLLTSNWATPGSETELVVAAMHPTDGNGMQSGNVGQAFFNSRRPLMDIGRGSKHLLSPSLANQCAFCPGIWLAVLGFEFWLPNQDRSCSSVRSHVAQPRPISLLCQRRFLSWRHDEVLRCAQRMDFMRCSH